MTSPGASTNNRAFSFALDLHGISVGLRVLSWPLLAYCRSLFRRHISSEHAQVEIILQLELKESPKIPPVAPASTTIMSQLRGIVCTSDQQRLFLEFDGRGAFSIDRSAHTIRGQVAPELLTEQHLLDRLVLGSLALLLRERHLFPVHAFAAARNGHAALLVGQPGTGKTTAGLALVRSGWGFLANDLPLLRKADQELQVLSCPERVYATAKTALLFPELHLLEKGQDDKAGFDVADVYPDAWTDCAVVRWLIFPRVTQDQPTRLWPMTVSDALIALLPHSLATWDRSMVPAHFSLLEQLARTVPAYQLELGTDVERWGSMLASLPATTTC